MDDLQARLVELGDRLHALELRDKDRRAEIVQLTKGVRVTLDGMGRLLDRETACGALVDRLERIALRIEHLVTTGGHPP